MASKTPSLDVPPPHERSRIPMRVIKAIVSHITRHFDPDKIILFGSHAYGQPHKWSDVDLLVVMETPHGELETALEILQSLPPHSFSIDIIVKSQATIDRRTVLGDWFLREVVARGLVLYERNRSGVGEES